MHMTSELSFDEIVSNLVITQIREFNGEYTILGTIKEDKALLFVKSISFTPEDIVKVLKNHTELNVILKNDVYSTFNISANGTYFLRMIYPADDEKVKKYTGRVRKYIKETKDMYDTKLNAEKQIMGHKNNWIRNIIEKGNELSTEKIFYSDDEIMIITNYKWDGKNVSNMYLLVLFKDEALYSIREVRDVKLLKRVKRVVSDVVKKEFGLGDEEVYCFFHYPPTYYVLHLHVVNANHYGNFCLIGKAILLDEAIENIEKDEDYYNKKAIWCFEY